MRAAAAETLGAISPVIGGTLPALDAALGDPDPDVRDAAGRALAAIGSEGLAILARALSHPNDRVFDAAARAVAGAGAGAGGAVPALRAQLERWDRARQLVAARTLAAIGPDAIPGLVDALGDGNAEVRKAAVEGLVRLGPKAAVAVPRLLRALRSGEPVPEREMAEARERFGQPFADPDEMRELYRWSVAPVPTRALAARVLGAIGPAARRALPDLLRAARDPDASVREAATAAVRSVEGGPPGGG
ncbi:MAG: HEAT repeat domain-containing protein [Planctomycetales bacterium]|nr:HEAT repeat domain-containing protein [Planctomycetales bacterium]